MLAIPSLHPAYLLRAAGDDSKGEARFKNTVIGDFRRALELTKRAPSWNEDQIHVKALDGRPAALFPTLAEFEQFAGEAWRACCVGDAVLTLDVETTGQNPLASNLICVGLTFGRGGSEKIINVPFMGSGGTLYWSFHRGAEARVRLILRSLLAAARHVNLQNGSFDTIVLSSVGMPIANWDSDTMLLSHVVDGELPHGLDYLASVYTEVPYWKGDVKGDTSWLDLPDEILRTYNLRDVLTTHRIREPLEEQAKRLKVWDLYQKEIAEAKIMAKATVKGLKVDLIRRDSTEPCSHSDMDKKGRCRTCGEYKPTRVLPIGLGPRMEIYRSEALDHLRSLAGDPEFNPGSHPQLIKLFYGRLGFPVVCKTKKGKAALDKTAMVLLALHADSAEKVAALRELIGYRRADKLLGTYIYGLPTDSLNRLHVIWKLLTVSGRFSSSPNAQNWNAAIKRLFTVDEGDEFSSIDLSQAELRGMGYISGDPELLAFYERDMNVHTLTATMLFDIRNPGADTNAATEEWLATRYGDEAYNAMPMASPHAWKETRKLAKNARFGWQYGAVPETVFDVLYSKIDSDTGEQMFPDLKVRDIQAIDRQLKKMHPHIVRWWNVISDKIMKAGRYVSPYSGRVHWFRSGFKRNDMLNRPIQELIASHMLRLIDIDRRLGVECPGTTIVTQVHDAITCEGPVSESKQAGAIMKEELSKPFDLPGVRNNCVLPPDEPTYGKYLSDV